MIPKDIGYSADASIDEKMLWATFAPDDITEGPELYIEARNRDRAHHSYSVQVDDNLVSVRGGADRIWTGHNEVVIPLPFIRGVSSIYERHTKGRGSCVDLLAFNITVAGQTDPTVIYQGEPMSWYKGTKTQQAFVRDTEMNWHKQQLLVLRHDVLTAVNGYINRVRALEPQDRQLKLGL